MRRHRLTATAAITAIAMITSQVLAGPNPSGAKAPDTTRAPGTPAGAEGANINPKFATKTADASLAKLVARLAGEGDRFLQGGPCAELDASGDPEGGYLDHCLAISVGTARAFTTYIVTDTECPDGNAASACYGGYVIANRSDLERDVESEPGVSATTTTVVSKVRFGLQRTRPRKGQTPLPGKSKYVLPVTPALTITRTTIVKPSSVDQRVVAVDFSGDTVLDFGQLTIEASDGTAASCEAQGEMAEARALNSYNLMITMFVVAAGAEILAASVLAGIAVAIVGTGGTLGLGAGAAVAAGIAVGGAAFGGGIGALGVLAMSLLEQAKSEAHLEGLEVQQACELKLSLAEMPLGSLEDLGEKMVSWDGTMNSAAANAECGSGGPTTDNFTDDDGREYQVTCTQSVVDGECKASCEAKEFTVTVDG